MVVAVLIVGLSNTSQHLPFSLFSTHTEQGHFMIIVAAVFIEVLFVGGGGVVAVLLLWHSY